MIAISACGRSWHASRIEGLALAPTRASTNASRPDGRGSAPRSLTTRTRQVEHRALPPQTLACGTLKRRLASRILKSPRHAHPAVGIRHRDRTAITFEQGANAAREKHQHDRRSIEDWKVKQRDLVDHGALRRRRRVQVFGAPLRLRRPLGYLMAATVGAGHGERRQQHGDRQQERCGPFEERLQPQPEIEADAGMGPGYREKHELDANHVGPCYPIGQQRPRIDWRDRARTAGRRAGRCRDDSRSTAECSTRTPAG